MVFSWAPSDSLSLKWGNTRLTSDCNYHGQGSLPTEALPQNWVLFLLLTRVTQHKENIRFSFNLSLLKVRSKLPTVHFLTLKSALIQFLSLVSKEPITVQVHPGPGCTSASREEKGEDDLYSFHFSMRLLLTRSWQWFPLEVRNGEVVKGCPHFL